MGFKQGHAAVDALAHNPPLTRAVLSTPAEMREQLLQVTRTAEHSLCIYTAELSPDLYGQAAFLKALKHLVLARRYARVRILSSAPATLDEHTQPICTMAMRLPSLIEIRSVPAADMGAAEFVVADGRALVYRIHRNRWDGMVEHNDPAVAKFYLTHFDSAWSDATPTRLSN